jgi:serine O-acetyltransferase
MLMLKELILSDLETYGKKRMLRSIPHAYFESLGFRASFHLRLISYFWNRKDFFVTNYLKMHLVKTCGLDAIPGFSIGDSFRVDHPVGVVIGKGAVIGSKVQIGAGVILGQRYVDPARRNERYPRIGSGVIIGANSVLLGEIEIGDSATIGAGSLVLTSVASGVTVSGLVK